MSQIHPIQALLDEHTLIEQALDKLEAALQRLQHDPAALDSIDEALTFLQDFADGMHQQKEESVLFPLLKRRGLEGAAHALLDEHRIGHRRLNAIAHHLSGALRGEGRAVAFIRTQGLAYVALMRDHIREENETLFKLARQVLTEDDIVQLDRLFSDREPEPTSLLPADRIGGA